MGQPVTAYIGLGSNMDDPVAQVTRAFAELDDLPATRLKARSPLYMTPPMGPQDQPDFINAAAALDTALAPEDLLQALLAIERAHGRRRDGSRWGPRSLDLDLLLYGGRVQQGAGLVIPHPGLHERPFVLYPLADIAPQQPVPDYGTVAELRDRHRDARIVRLKGAGP